jgi:hypothetical protein
MRGQWYRMKYSTLAIRVHNGRKFPTCIPAGGEISPLRAYLKEAGVLLRPPRGRLEPAKPANGVTTDPTQSKPAREAGSDPDSSKPASEVTTDSGAELAPKQLGGLNRGYLRAMLAAPPASRSMRTIRATEGFSASTTRT